MSKKAFIFGLLVTLTASLVGGAVSAPSAQAAYPYGDLICSPSVQSVSSGSSVNFYAYYVNVVSPYTGQMTWTAVNGYPVSGTGSTFTTQFYTANVNETRTVTVSDGLQSATCTVYVYSGVMPTPTPTPALSLSTNPAYTWDTAGYTTLTWDSTSMSNCTAMTYPANSQWSGSIAPNGTKTIYGLSANTSFVIDCYSPIHAQRLAYFTANSAGVTPTPLPTVATTTTNVSVVGRNVTLGQSGEYKNLRARGGDTLDLIVRVRSNGSYLTNTYVTDILPGGLTYIPGSTTINGSVVADGITTSGIWVGTVGVNAVTSVKFSARVDGSYVPYVGAATITNTAQVRADGLGTTSVQTPIVIGMSLAAIASVKTGPADTLMLALLIALFATGGYAVYTSTNLFGRRVALAEIKHLSQKSGLNFSR